MQRPLGSQPGEGGWGFRFLLWAQAPLSGIYGGRQGTSQHPLLPSSIAGTCVDVLTLSTSEWDCFGDGVFRETIKLKLGR